MTRCAEIAKNYFEAVQVANHAQAVADAKNNQDAAAKMRRVCDYLWFQFLAFAHGE